MVENGLRVMVKDAVKGMGVWGGEDCRLHTMMIWRRHSSPRNVAVHLFVRPSILLYVVVPF